MVDGHVKAGDMDDVQEEADGVIIDELCTILTEIKPKYEVCNLITYKRRQFILKQIEEFTLNILQCIRVDGKLPPIQYRVRNWDNIEIEDDVINLKLSNGDPNAVKMGTIKCRKNSSSYPNFLLCVKIIHECLTSNKTYTKRQLFYENLINFKNQGSLNVTLNHVCCYFNVALYEFGVFGSQKSLLAGPIKIHLSNETISYSINDKGGLLPLNIGDITKIETNAKFALIVEKDTVFEKLLNDNFLQKFYPCLLMTGKGYGDIAIRRFINMLVEIYRLPIYGLFDADAFGIDIMCNYKFGSLTMSFIPQLAIPSLQWVGVYPSELIANNVVTHQLSDYDLKKIDSLLKRPYVVNNVCLEDEIGILKSWNIKAEVEDIYLGTNYVTDIYLRNKFRNCNV